MNFPKNLIFILVLLNYFNIFSDNRIKFINDLFLHSRFKVKEISPEYIADLAHRTKDLSKTELSNIIYNAIVLASTKNEPSINQSHIEYSYNSLKKLE